MDVYEREDGQEGEMRGAQHCLGDVGCDRRSEEDLDSCEDGDGEEREEEGEERSLYKKSTISNAIR